MKKILGLIASKRRHANGELLSKEVAAAAGDDCQLELLRLADLNLGFCRGCYTCVIPGKRCPVNDGLYFLVEKIKAADGIILSAPCYALGPAAVTKVFGDRVIALAQLYDEFWGKPCVVVATAGVEGLEGYTLTALNTITRFLGFDLKDSQMFIGALPGEGVLGEGALTRAREMGTALFGRSRQVRDGECPTCWSQTWKFVDPQTVVCPMCGQRASLVVGDEGVKWVHGSAGNMFNRDTLENHFKRWLRIKAQEFISRREELAEVRNRYRGNDIWLKPDKLQT